MPDPGQAPAPGPQRCRACHAEIIWVKTAKGNWTPQNLDYSSHWGTCPAAKQFKKKKHA